MKFIKPNSVKTLTFLIIAFLLFSFKSDKRAYCVYTKNAKSTSYKKMLKEAEKADIILFGELHNNVIAHWLQLQLTKDLYKNKKQDLILGAEMFEADDQVLVNEYLQGLHSSKTFARECKLWDNYKTDYKPLLEFAKSNQLHFVASNIPRRYANMVYKKGLESLDSLSAEAKQWIVPLPMAYDTSLNCYKNILKMAGGHGGHNLPKSQAIKDATMSHFVLKNWSKGKTLIHYNGSYHSNHFESMYWYLKKGNPDLKIMTINCVEQSDIDSLSTQYKNSANFIIAIPSDMTKSY